MSRIALVSVFCGLWISSFAEPLWTPTFASMTWNEVLDAKGIFPEEMDALPLTAVNGDSFSSLHGHLNTLLEQPGVLEKVYLNYMNKFGKSNEMYSESRARVFKTNLLNIARHNEATAEGKMSWTKAVNLFTDRTPEERKAMFRPISNAGLPIRNVTVTSSDLRQLPTSVNWVAQGKVTEVKLQNPCNNCFMFAAAAMAETRQAVKSGKTQSLSVQQILDCCPITDCWKNYPSGCANPGFIEGALNYAKNKGLALESDYPYEGKDGTCQDSQKKLIKQVVPSFSWYYNNGKPDNENNMAVKAALNPIGVAIDASDSLMQYGKGVYDKDIFGGDCKSDSTDHVVTIVGFTSDYWLIKNSWGTTWGLDGYGRLKRGVNQCAIATNYYYLTV